MTDTTLAKANLGDSVYRVLLDRVLDRRLRPGQKLSDVTLSAELGVSRTPVREALLRLVQDGVLRAEPNRGFYVASFSPRDIEEIYELRATLECMALEIAAPRLTRGFLDEAMTDLRRCEAAYSGAVDERARSLVAEEFLDIDRAFHRAIVEAAGNSRLTAAVEGLAAQIAVFQRAGARRGWTDVSIRHHRAILAALAAGDHPAATAALRRHILDVKALVIADLAAEPRDEERFARIDLGGTAA